MRNCESRLFGSCFSNSLKFFVEPTTNYSALSLFILSVHLFKLFCTFCQRTKNLFPKIVYIHKKISRNSSDENTVPQKRKQNLPSF